MFACWRSIVKKKNWTNPKAWSLPTKLLGSYCMWWPQNMILMGLQFSSSCCGATWEWLIFWAMPVAHLFPPFLSRWRGFFLVYLLTDWATFRRSKGWQLIKRWFICWLDLNGRELYLAWSVHHLIPDTKNLDGFSHIYPGLLLSGFVQARPLFLGELQSYAPNSPELAK